MDTTHQETIRAYLDEVREREKGATEGPWFRDWFGTPDRRVEVVDSEKQGIGGGRIISAEYDMMRPADFDFIAAARTDIPRLLDMLEVALEALEYPDAHGAWEALQEIAAIARGDEGQEA